MNIPEILSSLRSERDRLNKAIAALEGLDGAGASTRRALTTRTSAVVASKLKRRKSRLTPAGRKRLSENMKKRWAERRKKAAKAA